MALCLGANPVYQSALLCRFEHSPKPNIGHKAKVIEDSRLIYDQASIN